MMQLKNLDVGSYSILMLLIKLSRCLGILHSDIAHKLCRCLVLCHSDVAQKLIRSLVVLYADVA